MNLSELIHRPSEDGQSVVSSNYESSFQRSPTEPMHLDTLYNKVGSDLMDTRFATDHHNHQHQHLIHDAYSSSKLMTTSSSNSSSGSPHWQFAPPESSRSPYASTLSDQSVNEPIRPTSDLRGGSGSTTSNSTTGGGGANSSTNGGVGGSSNSGAMSTSARGPSSNSPVSPIPLDNTSSVVDHLQYRKRRLSLNDSSTFNTFSPDDKSTDQRLASKSTSGIAGLYGRKDMALTINGTNVTKDNIEEGYVQFIWHNDPSYIGDSIENLMYVKRKFSSVPKTGDLAYTTWDVYALVKKLHNNEIKNWSQLVGRLGLADVPGRPQFAQRVKRWMRKYRIDCYFDYLLGNTYNFNAGPNDEYTGCLVMGNYQKRRGNRTHTMVTNNTATAHSTDDIDSRRSTDELSFSTTRKRQKHHDEDDNRDESADNDEEDDDDRSTRRTPIAHAGSRKRARNQPLLASAIDDQEHDDREHLTTTTTTTAAVTEEEREAANTEDNTQMAEQPPSVYPMEYLREDEEDELASSTSSSPATSPAASSPEPSHESLSLSAKSTKPRQQQHPSTSPTVTTTSPAAPPLSPSSTSLKDTDAAIATAAPITDPSLLSSPSPSQPPASSSSVAAVVPTTTNASPCPQSPSHHHSHLPSSSCPNCTRLQDTVTHLQDDIVLLKQQLSTMQTRLNEESEAKTAMARRIDQLCTHYDKWRTRLAEQLLQSPFAE